MHETKIKDKVTRNNRQNKREHAAVLSFQIQIQGLLRKKGQKILTSITPETPFHVVRYKLLNYI
jgi:hypothetical protein